MLIGMELLGTLDRGGKRVQGICRYLGREGESQYLGFRFVVFAFFHVLIFYRS